MTSTLYKFPSPSTQDPAISRPDASRIVSGAPEHRSWDFDRFVEGRLSSGIWESEPGSWRAAKGDSWELCHFLAGEGEIVEGDRPPVRFAAGDTILLRPGFVGAWNIIKTVRKVYVIWK